MAQLVSPNDLCCSAIPIEPLWSSPRVHVVVHASLATLACRFNEASSPRHLARNLVTDFVLVTSIPPVHCLSAHPYPPISIVPTGAQTSGLVPQPAHDRLNLGRVQGGSDGIKVCHVGIHLRRLCRKHTLSFRQSEEMPSGTHICVQQPITQHTNGECQTSQTPVVLPKEVQLRLSHRAATLTYESHYP